jgi:hypothetical protein
MNDIFNAVVTTDSPFFGDKLNRFPVARYLTDYLIGKHKIAESKYHNRWFVFNLNSPWGVGKTYFLTEWLKLLEAEDHLTVYFDAWKNDFSEQPIIGLMSEIESELRKKLPIHSKAISQLSKFVKQSSKLIKTAAPQIAVAVLKAATTVDLHKLDIGEILTNSEFSKESEKIILKIKENLYKENKKTKNAIAGFKTELSKLVALAKIDFNLPIFIFVDELDRCRPTFSIQLLEDIKHLFGIDDIYFIVATDSAQLAHSIKAIYGNSFNATEYLQRFFDQEFSLPDPNRFDYSCHLFSKYSLDSDVRLFSGLDYRCYKDINLNVQIFALLADAFSLSLRAMEQACVMIDAIRITSQGKLHTGYLAFFVMLRIVAPSIFVDATKGDLTLMKAIENLENKFTSRTLYQCFHTNNGVDFISTTRSVQEYIQTYVGFSALSNTELNRSYNDHSETGRLIIDCLNRELGQRPLIEYPNLVKSASGLIRVN